MNEPVPSTPILTEIPRYEVPPAQETQPVAPLRIPTLNLVLFGLTLLTTTMAGAYLAGVDHPLTSPSGLAKGLTFSLPLMAILLFHEMGHFLVARHHRVNASWPYFIPAPYPSYFFFGTFGAFIRMKSSPRSRKVMFDVGAAGPWAGVILAIPIVIIGLKLSEVAPLESAGGLELGDSLMFNGLARVVLGVDPNAVAINLHPIGLAGWIGLLVTMFNLLPVGQLDGGHVVYALLGRRHRIISRLFVVGCVAMVIVPLVVGWSYWLGWILWAVLLLALGLGHPSTVDAETPLDKPRRVAAVLTIALFALTFSPVPLSFTPPAEKPQRGDAIEVSVPAPAPPIRHLISL